MNNKPSNTLAIIGLVIAIIALILSFIPCVGTIAFIPGLIGLILGVIAFVKAKDNGHPKGMPIAVIVISLISCILSVVQYYTLKNMAPETKEYTNCEELVRDYNASQSELKAITEEMEKDDSKAFANIGKVAKLGVKIGNMQEQAEELGCDLDLGALYEEPPAEILEAVEKEGEIEMVGDEEESTGEEGN